MATINGKEVKFRDRFPFQQSKQLPKLMAAVDDSDWDTIIPVLQAVVESWEFAGDPKAAESYQELDLFTELGPMINKATEHIKPLVEAMRGN